MNPWFFKIDCPIWVDNFVPKWLSHDECDMKSPPPIKKIYSLRPKMIVRVPNFGKIKACWPLTK